jgi:hypothetical protein
LKSVITYFSGGVNYAVPSTLVFDYCLRHLRFIFISYLISYYFQAEYSIITMACAMVLADLRFYMDFDDYMTAQDELLEELAEDENKE